MQCVCNAWLKIIDLTKQWPGSCTNQIIFNNSTIKHKFEAGIIQGYLLGNGTYEVEPYLMTPVSNPTTACESLYNESLNIGTDLIEK